MFSQFVFVLKSKINQAVSLLVHMNSLSVSRTHMAPFFFIQLLRFPATTPREAALLAHSPEPSSRTLCNSQVMAGAAGGGARSRPLRTQGPSCPRSSSETRSSFWQPGYRSCTGLLEMDQGKKHIINHKSIWLIIVMEHNSIILHQTPQHPPNVGLQLSPCHSNPPGAVCTLHSGQAKTA